MSLRCLSFLSLLQEVDYEHNSSKPDATVVFSPVVVELERALQLLDDEVSRIIGEGDKARIDLDTGRAWVQGR